MRAPKAQSKRCLLACAIVLASFCGLACAGESEQAAAVDDFGIRALDEAALANGPPEAVLDEVEAALARWKGAPSADFVREIGILENATDVYVCESQGIFGYSITGAAVDVQSRISTAMHDRGWNEVPLTGLVGATFLKREGSYTWALITCTQVGDSTSVVVRCIKEGGARS